jgi:S1-C subfamily serine protease
VAIIDADDCYDPDGHTGTGVLIAPNLVATAGHMLDEQTNFVLKLGGKKVHAQAIGLDRSSDVGLLRLERPVPFAPLQLATTWPDLGSRMMVVGNALGLGLSIQQGGVANTNVTYHSDVDDVTLHGLLQLDTTEDHGSSGGPVIDENARVLGMISRTTDDQRLEFAAGSPGAAALVAKWSKHPQRLAC